MTDTRGTRTPSAKTLVRRANKKIAQNAAISSARDAGYRKGYDSASRAADTKYDNEINTLRNQVATIAEDTLVKQDREIVRWALAQEKIVDDKSPTITVPLFLMRAVARTLIRLEDQT